MHESSSGGLTRRVFIKQGGFIALLVATSVSVLDACSTAPAPAAPSAATTVVANGGNAIEAPTTEVPHVSPLLANPGAIVSTMFDGLLGLLVDGNLEPLLAQSLPKVSSDGLTYTFDLRKDIKWTDGTPLTSDDVVFTYRLMYDTAYKDFPSPNRADLEGVLADVSAPDANTVVMKTKGVNASFLVLHARYGVLPRHVLGDVAAADLQKHEYMTAPMVTHGPMKFKEWVSGDHLTVVRNDACYRGAPHLDSYTARFYAQQASIPTALKTGEIDMTYLTQAGFFDELKALPTLQLSTFVNGAGARLAFNMDPAAPVGKIFSSKAVRQALLYGADRDGAAKATLFGYGARANGIGVFWPGSWAENPDATPQYLYDKSKAAELLDSDGWVVGSSGIREKNGVPLSFELLTSANNNVWQQISQVFKENWKQIGVDATITAQQYAQVTTRTLARDFDMVMFQIQYGPLDPDPSTAFHSRNAVKNGRNFSNYKNPAVDQLLDDAVATLDQTKRKELYFKLQDILNEDVPMFSTWFWHFAWVINKRIKSTGPERVGPYTSNYRTYVNEWYV